MSIFIKFGFIVYFINIRGNYMSCKQDLYKWVIILNLLQSYKNIKYNLLTKFDDKRNLYYKHFTL